MATGKQAEAAKWKAVDEVARRGLMDVNVPRHVVGDLVLDVFECLHDGKHPDRRGLDTGLGLVRTVARGIGIRWIRKNASENRKVDGAFDAAAAEIEVLAAARMARQSDVVSTPKPVITPDAMRAADIAYCCSEWQRMTGAPWTEETADFFFPMNQLDDRSYRLDGEARLAAKTLGAALVKARKSLGPALAQLADVNAKIEAAEIGTMRGRPALGTLNGLTVYFARDPAAQAAAALGELEAALKMYPPTPLRPRRGRPALELMFWIEGAPTPLDPDELPRLMACAWILLGGVDIRDHAERIRQSAEADASGSGRQRGPDWLVNEERNLFDIAIKASLGQKRKPKKRKPKAPATQIRRRSAKP